MTKMSMTKDQDTKERYVTDEAVTNPHLNYNQRDYGYEKTIELTAAEIEEISKY